MSTLELDGAIWSLLDAGPNVFKPQALSALAASVEFRALLNPNYDHTDDSRSRAAIQTMEENYASHLSLMKADTYHWRSIQPKAALIDWTLLSVWVSRIRRDRLAPSSIPFPPHDSETSEFIRLLAERLS